MTQFPELNYVQELLFAKVNLNSSISCTNVTTGPQEDSSISYPSQIANFGSLFSIKTDNSLESLTAQQRLEAGELGVRLLIDLAPPLNSHSFSLTVLYGIGLPIMISRDLLALRDLSRAS